MRKSLLDSHHVVTSTSGNSGIPDHDHYNTAENDSTESTLFHDMLSLTDHLSSTYSRFLRHRERRIVNGTDVLVDIEDDDDYYTYDNNTYTTSVSIRITPTENYFVSWGILWACFFFASCFAVYQLYYKDKISKLGQRNTTRLTESTRQRRRRRDGGGGGGLNVADLDDNDDDSSPGSIDGKSTSTPHITDSKSSSRLIRPSSSGNNFYYVVPNNRTTNEYIATDGEENAPVVSSADEARTMFRRILLLAMISRMIMMPIMIWTNPQWYQFVGDTLPEMIFASAWTLLVTFFVQLVGIATGTGTNVSPGIVIQATAYVVYLFLIGTQLVNKVATILLYALLCCIYAALLGVVLYFFPKLISLIQPTIRQSSPSPPPPPPPSTSNNNQRHSLTNGGRALSIRLTLCTVLCISVFLARAIGYARLVVMPPRRVYWWWNYGVLELLPTFIFLLIMHPTTNKVDRDSIDPDVTAPPVIQQAPLFGWYRLTGGAGSSGILRRNDSGILRRSDSNNFNNNTTGPVTTATTTATGSNSNDNTPNSRSGVKQHVHETTSLLKGGVAQGTTRSGVEYGTNATTTGVGSGNNASITSATVATGMPLLLYELHCKCITKKGHSFINQTSITELHSYCHGH